MSHYVNLDAASTAFFERELEQIKARSFDVLKAPLSANRLIPVDSTTSPGAKVVTYQQYDGVGIAKIVSNYADDLPTADISGKEFSSFLKSIGNSYVYSIEDIRAAQFAGKPLEQRKANQAVRAHQEAMNRLAFFGSAEHGIQGWLTNANIPAAAVEAGDSGDTEWEDKTPDEILKDLNDAVTAIIDLTNGAETPNTVVMPIKQYQLIATTRQAAGTDTTILQYFLGNSPVIQSVEWANELKGAFAGSTDGFIVYDRNPDKLYQEIPQMVEMFAPQENNLAFKVPVHSKHGGTIVPYPLAQVFRYGI
jgi:hypothetical protein